MTSWLIIIITTQLCIDTPLLPIQVACYAYSSSVEWTNHTRKKELNLLLLIFLRPFLWTHLHWRVGGILVSPMPVESGSEIGPALSVRYVPVVSIVSHRLEHREGLVFKI
jgi:hypothetical protein